MNLNKETAKAVLLLKKQSQWQGFLFCIKLDSKTSWSKTLDSSSSCSLAVFDSFLFRLILNEVVTLCNLGATANASIELRVKYFLPKPFSNFN